MTQHQVELLTPEKFLHYWPMIEKQLDHVPHLWALWWTKDSIRDSVVAERFQCWGIGDAGTIHGIVFTQVVMYPANLVFQAFLAFGEGLTDAMDEIEATFERYCVIRGATLAEVTGRPGWGPRLRKKGFRQTCGAVFSKKLEPMRMQ
jgi:hypothetical protein